MGQTKPCTESRGEGVCGEEKGLVILTTEISEQTAAMRLGVLGSRAGGAMSRSPSPPTFSSTHSIGDPAPSPY